MKYKLLAWVPAVLIMGIIFSFSAKPAVKSSESSIAIADRILKVYENISDQQIDQSLRINRLLQIEHIVRKSAHITEYAILAASIAFALWISRFSRYKILWSSILISALYAATDEFHQRFVPGRSGEIRDVLIDTAGACLGALIFLAVIAVITRKQKNTGEVNPTE